MRQQQLCLTGVDGFFCVSWSQSQQFIHCDILLWKKDVWMHDLCVCVRVCVDPLYPAGWSLPHEAESRKLWLPSKFHIYGAKFEDVPSARCKLQTHSNFFQTIFPPSRSRWSRWRCKMSVAGFKKQFYKASQVNARLVFSSFELAG